MQDGNTAPPIQEAFSPLFLDIANDLGIDLTVPASDVWTWRRLATRPSVPQDEDGSRKEVAARRNSYSRQARHATSRVYEIERLLRHRHNGPCDTDDGWSWFEAVCPFIIEKAEITRRSFYIEVLGWAVRYLPHLVEDVGLFQLAIEANVYAEKRNQAEIDQADLGLSFVRWLPTNRDLLDMLRPTWDEITTLQIKGWVVVDRPDAQTLKKRATDQRRGRRHSQGVRPQATRTREKDLEVAAAEMGISLSTLKRRMRLKPTHQVDRKVSDPLTFTCRTDRFRSPEPANDDVPLAAPAPTPGPALTDTGYIGRNMRMDAWEVKAAVQRHPILADNLQQHLGAIDDLMVKTPAEYSHRVRRNLLQDRSRLAHREKRTSEKAAAAAAVPMDAFVGQNITLTADEVGTFAADYPALADRLHDHLADLEGPLRRIPRPSRKGGLRRAASARNKLMKSARRFDKAAA